MFLLNQTTSYSIDTRFSYKNDDGTPIIVNLYALVKISIEPEIAADDMKYENEEAFCKSKKGRKVTFNVLGGITHRDFLDKKHYAPTGVRCNLQNLEQICRGLPPIRSINKGTKQKRGNKIII